MSKGNNKNTPLDIARHDAKKLRLAKQIAHQIETLHELGEKIIGKEINTKELLGLYVYKLRIAAKILKLSHLFSYKIDPKSIWIAFIEQYPKRFQRSFAQQDYQNKALTFNDTVFFSEIDRALGNLKHALKNYLRTADPFAELLSNYLRVVNKFIWVVKRDVWNRSALNSEETLETNHSREECAVKPLSCTARGI